MTQVSITISETARENFEKWASGRGWPLRKCEDGSYADGRTNAVWIGWAACWSQGLEKRCQKCNLLLTTNGSIFWCEGGHVYEACGGFPQEMRDVLASLKEFIRLANWDGDTICKTNEEWDAMVKRGESAIAKADSMSEHPGGDCER